MKYNLDLINKYYQELEQTTKDNLNQAIDKIIEAKKKNGKIMVVTGSGPNIHEGVTVLISELMDKDIINNVSTSSAVIAHEMAGSLDKVKRIEGNRLGFKPNSSFLPRGDIFEFTKMGESDLEKLKNNFYPCNFTF